MRAIKRITLFWIVSMLIVLPGVIGSQSSNFLSEVCRIFLGASIESSPAGGDWPMFRKDAEHTGYLDTQPDQIFIGSNDLGIHALNSSNCSRNWRFQTGGPVKSSPAVDIQETTTMQDGTEIIETRTRVYIGSDDGKLYALDETGRLVYSFTPPSDLFRSLGNVHIPSIFRSSPLVSEELQRIFIGNDDGLVYSITTDETADEVLLNRYPGAPAPPPGTVTDDNSVQNPPDTNNLVPFPVGSIRSSLVLDRLTFLQGLESLSAIQVYFTTGDRRFESIRADLDDQRLTTTPELVPISSDSDILDSPSVSTPAVSKENFIYVGTLSGALYSYRPDFIQVWRVSLNGDIIASPSISNTSTIYVGTTNGTMYGIRANGTIQCTFQVLGPDGRANSGDELFYGIRSSAAVTPDGLVIFGADDGHIYVIRDQTCQLRAFFKTNGPIVSSPMVVSGENQRFVYFGSGDGFFYTLSLF